MNKHVTIMFKVSTNFTPIEKHKIQQAIDQYNLKTEVFLKKLKNRVKRIIKENDKQA